ncbi:MAG: hypothetical protein IPF99_37450 [Deltaproteobacteria bacterium]|nr:hypothetical protein [Deltaproteobacteria bacterium]
MTPSNAHESVLLWLRDDPSRLSTLLALTGHAPCSSTLAVEDSALRAAYPIEVTPDLVLRRSHLRALGARRGAAPAR